MDGVPEEIAREAIRLASMKLPFCQSFCQKGRIDMKASELRDMSLDELGERVKDLQEELFNLRFQHGSNQLENPMRLGQTKKDIARVLTVIGEKSRAVAR